MPIAITSVSHTSAAQDDAASTETKTDKKRPSQWTRTDRHALCPSSRSRRTMAGGHNRSVSEAHNHCLRPPSFGVIHTTNYPTPHDPARNPAFPSARSSQS